MARVGQLHVDNGAFPLLANQATSAGEETSWGVGLNWHLNKNLKLSLDYDQTALGKTTNPTLKKGEKVIMTRAQIAF